MPYRYQLVRRVPWPKSFKGNEVTRKAFAWDDDGFSVTRTLLSLRSRSRVELYLEMVQEKDNRKPYGACFINIPRIKENPSFELIDDDIVPEDGIKLARHRFGRRHVLIRFKGRIESEQDRENIREQLALIATHTGGWFHPEVSEKSLVS